MQNDLVYCYSLLKATIPQNQTVKVLEKVYAEKGNLYTVLTPVKDGQKAFMYLSDKVSIYNVQDTEVDVRQNNTVVFKFNSNSILVYVHTLCVIYLHVNLYNYIMSNKPKHVKRIIPFSVPLVTVGGERLPTTSPINNIDRRGSHANRSGGRDGKS